MSSIDEAEELTVKVTTEDEPLQVPTEDLLRKSTIHASTVFVFPTLAYTEKSCQPDSIGFSCPFKKSKEPFQVKILTTFQMILKMIIACSSEDRHLSHVAWPYRTEDMCELRIGVEWPFKIWVQITPKRWLIKSEGFVGSSC
eukprot:4561566-Amphidinium_carterae.1